MNPLTVAIAGCGSRGFDTYAQCQKRFPELMKIVAAADIRPERLQLVKEQFGLDDSQLYSSAEEMLAKGKIADVLFVCTPDRCHFAQASEGLKLGYHLLLEKPIASTLEECKEIARLAEENKRQVVVCHVLRYTVFYDTLKKLLDSGRIGRLATIQAIENVCYWHQAHSFVRGNWRNEGLSSCMILQKCCHDMDMFLYLTGKHCKAVSSFGSLMHFTADNAPEGAPMRCTENCPAADTCPYNAVNYYMGKVENGDLGWPVNVVATNPTKESVLEALKTGPYGRCVYHCDNDVVDHQVVNMLLEDEVTINFTMTAFTQSGGRRIRLMGTMGEIDADMEANVIKVLPFGGEPEIIDVTKLTDDFSGHGGGDAIMLREFLTMLMENGQPSNRLTAVSRSVESHIMAFAAEESRKNNGKAIIL